MCLCPTFSITLLLTAFDNTNLSSQLTMESYNNSADVHKLMHLNDQINKACDQVLLLNRNIQDLERRYDRAAQEQRKSFRYTLRLRLATLEGLRSVFLEFAKMKAGEMDDLEAQLMGRGMIAEDL